MNLMNISGVVPFIAPAAAVWQLLTTPEQLCGCMPGLQAWRPVTDHHFELDLTWQFGPNGQKPIPVTITWTRLHPPTELETTAVIIFNRLPIHIDGRLTLNATSPVGSEVYFNITVNSPNAFIDQLARSLAPRLIDSYFACLKNRV
jgi:hypothetical protein